MDRAMRALRKGGFKRVTGEAYATPKEVWGFRTHKREGSPEAVARQFLVASGDLFKLAPDLAGLRFQRRIDSLGAHHLIFQQVHSRRRVHRAYVTVHMDRAGRVFLSKNRAMPASMLPATVDVAITRADAIRRALRALPRRRGGGGRGTVQGTEAMWFPRGAKLAPAWRGRVARHKPAQEWIVYESPGPRHALSSVWRPSATTPRT